MCSLAFHAADGEIDIDSSSFLVKEPIFRVPTVVIEYFEASQVCVQSIEEERTIKDRQPFQQERQHWPFEAKARLRSACEDLLVLGEFAQHGSLGVEDECRCHLTSIVDPENCGFLERERGMGFEPRALDFLGIHD